MANGAQDDCFMVQEFVRMGALQLGRLQLTCCIVVKTYALEVNVKDKPFHNCKFEETKQDPASFPGNPK